MATKLKRKTVTVSDPDGLLAELTDDTEYVAVRGGGYVMGGSYVNEFIEIRIHPKEQS